MTKNLDSQLRNEIKKKLSRNTQMNIGKKLGYSQSYISKILSGAYKPKNYREILKKISDQIVNSKFSIN